MKRCKVCNRLTDNGDKHCPKCGSPFPYDPKVSPYSETKIALIVLVLAVLAVVLVNAVVGFIQESRAESAIESLMTMMTTQAVVLRDGGTQTAEAGGRQVMS